MLKKDGRDCETVLRLLGIQAVLVVFSAAVRFWMAPDIGTSLLAGSCIGLVVNSWMALVVFRRSAAKSADRLLFSLYVGEIGKFMFAIALFAIAFRGLDTLRQPKYALLMFLAFLLVQSVSWLWPLIETKSHSEPKY